jgi:hypothetical protein
VLYPMLQAFDSPAGDAARVRRSRSNTPLQALTTLNEPLFMECAQALAKKTLAEGGATNEQRLTYIFRRVLSRPPTKAEADELLAVIAKHPDDSWPVVSRILLNLDETITKE